MSYQFQIIAKLKDLLKNNQTLSEYIKEVLFLEREGITIFPVITISPVTHFESNETFPIQNIFLTIDITGHLKILDKEQFIDAQTDIKDLFDLENDIKTALDSNRSLDGLCIDTKITESTYTFTNWPICSVTVRVECLYRQKIGER